MGQPEYHGALFKLTIHFAGQTIKKRIADDSPDKAKPFAKRGRKAAGLHGKMAELPKEASFGVLGFLYQEKPCPEKQSAFAR